MSQTPHDNGPKPPPRNKLAAAFVSKAKLSRKGAMQSSDPGVSNEKTSLEASNSSPVTPYQSYQDPLDPVEQTDQASQTTDTSRSALVANARTDALRGDYRGFSTSITDSFTSLDNERVDCCAITCCGVLQGDRDRYLLTGTKPPTCMRRLWLHIGLPIAIFLVAGYCALTIPSVYWNQLACTFLMTFLVCYLIMQCCKGQWKRTRVRRELLYRMHQIRQRNSGANHLDEEVPDFDEDYEPNPRALAPRADYTNGQSPYDLRCAHAILGCYNTDIPTLQEARDKKIHGRNDLCSKMWQFFQKSCCGRLCGCHLQCCGMCAMAQEARQLEVLLPASRRRMDYVSLQPMMHYYPEILRLRQEGNRQLVKHWKALSQLSKSLLLYSAVGLAILFVFSLLPIDKKFMFLNYLIMLGALLQPVVIIYVVHWQWHRLDISVDAVIKYFASGFCLSTSLAVTWELMGALVIRSFVLIIMTLMGIDSTSQNEYARKQMLPFPEVGGGFSYKGDQDGGHRVLQASVHDYIVEWGEDHPFLYAIYLLFSAFIMAALVEELCKYFGFRMVDHPDFMSSRELAKAAEAPVPHQEQQDTEGGNGTITAVPDFSAQRRTHRSHAAAVTIAMVAVATGFACAENLVYLFVYNGGKTLSKQFSVLLYRCFLPVHPVAAAIMSVGVCRRLVEKEQDLGLGKIILPSVVFHGVFDWGLLLLDFWAGLGGKDAADDTKLRIASILSVTYSAFVMMAGVAYYYKTALQQRRRLEGDDTGDAVANATTNVDPSS